MSLDEDLIASAGGLSVDGRLVTPSALWNALRGATTVHILGSDRRTVVGEIRCTPGGAGVYLDFVERTYSLLSPEELSDLAQTEPERLALVG